MSFKDFLLKNRKEKLIRLFFDIETLQYNEAEGKEKPTKYKNVTYSFAISYFNDDQLEVSIFPTSKMFFDTIIDTYSKWKTLPRFELIAHNNNKYDNHYLRHDLIYYYDVKVKNLFLKHAIDEGNIQAYTIKDLTPEEKQKGVILEKRIKSSINLELIFFLNGIQFFTTDNFMKTNVGIEVLGKKLNRLNLLTEDQMKTDYNYTKYNKPYDMTEEESRELAKEVFEQLSPEELTYIRNDVIILGKAVRYYSRIFKGFDYKKITFTSNILEFYNDNPLTSYQLLHKIGTGRDQIHLKYTDYKFANENFYDYLKPFYSGGLNMYNQKYLGKILTKPIFAMDINSSYPYVMHSQKIPTFLKEYDSFDNEKKVPITLDQDSFTLYRMTKGKFDYEILDQIESRMMRQILVKYYTKNDFININSYTIRLIENVCGIKITELSILSYVSFECVPFGSRDKIQENYFIKTQGKHEKKIKMNSPYDIEILDEENTEHLTPEEIDNSKVLLNGLYGIPALRPRFNLFRQHGDMLQNVENGYQNAERNIVFSIFVTSVALYNLLNPLKYLTQKEIDENLIYTDTDSLYLFQRVQDKIPNDLFHDYHLGKWGIDSDEIDRFYVINHKKYAYQINHNGDKKIIVKSGGIPHSSFDLDMAFEDFIDTQFKDGVKIKNTKSIYNEQGTISIYESTTELEIGQGYRLLTNDLSYKERKEKMFQDLRNLTKGEQDDLLFIESSLGTFSLSDLYPITHENKLKEPLIYLELKEEEIKRKIDNF